MTCVRDFDYDRTLAFLRAAACEGRFVSYGDITRLYGIADQDWPYVAAPVMRHLDGSIAHGKARGMPALAVLSVPRAQRQSGTHPARRVRKLVRMLAPPDLALDDAAGYIRREQKACFAWGARQRPHKCPKPYAPQPPRKYGAVFGNIPYRR